MGKTFEEFKNEMMQNPEFQEEYDALGPEFEIIRAIVEARAATGMTQKQLSEATGITQADISKLERGTSNPSLRTLKRIAEGMGMQLHIEFRPPANPRP